MKRLLALLLTIAVLITCTVANAASSYSDLISSVLDSMNQNNKSASGAPQQTANGAYRAVEMLSLMAYRLDSSKSYTEIIDSAIDTLNAITRGCLVHRSRLRMDHIEQSRCLLLWHIGWILQTAILK